MSQYPSDIAFTPAVKALQEAKGSREAYRKLEEGAGWKTDVEVRLSDFIAERDMFYLATSNAAGQPYVQYRGGPKGFLKVLDEKTLAFADFGGNQQYISLGNLSENPKAFIFLMDYEHSRRMKVWGTARVVEDDPELLERLSDPSYRAHPERAIVFTIETWDVNCPQHIHKRIPKDEVEPVIEELQARIQELEARLAERDGEDPDHSRDA